MPNRFILILVLVILTACASNQPKTVNEPDWFLSVPSNPDTVYGTGVDEKSEIYAVASALFSIALAVEANISGFDRRIPSGSDKKYESICDVKEINGSTVVDIDLKLKANYLNY